MKRNLIKQQVWVSLLLLLTAICSLTASAENKWILEAKTLTLGENLLQLQLVNTDEANAFQFDLKLPDQLEMNADMPTLNSDRITNHEMHWTKLGNNLFRCVVSSPTNDNFSGNEGILLAIPVIVHAEFSEGQLTMADMVLTNKQADRLDITAEMGMLTLQKADVKIFAPSGTEYRLYDRTDGGYTSYGWGIGFDGLDPSMYIRVQLEDPTNPDALKWGYKTGEASSREMSILNGGFWAKAEDCMFAIWGEEKFFHLQISANKLCSTTYTLSVYEKDDLNATPLASVTRTLEVIGKEAYPVLNDDTNQRVIGELNTNVALPVKMTNAGFLEGQAATLRLVIEAQPETASFTVIGSDWVNEPYTNVYVRNIAQLTSGQDYAFVVKATENIAGTYRVELLNAQGETITEYYDGSFMIPLVRSEDDINAILELAQKNLSHSQLQTFVKNKAYLQNLVIDMNNEVAVSWNADSPVRISYFGIVDSHFGDLADLSPLSKLTALETLDLQNIKRGGSLNLKPFTQLNSLFLWNTSFTWDQVTLPENGIQNMNGKTYIPAGTPINDWNSTAANGVEIDLSAYSGKNGIASTFQWYKGSNEDTPIQMPAVPNRQGVFIMDGEVDGQYWCKISNPQYKNWTMRTPLIKVTDSMLDFSAVDTLALRNLANANPQFTPLMEYVNSKGWEMDYWDNWSYPIWTKWANINGERRLTQIRIHSWSNERITSLDLSAFPTLTYFDCEENLDIDTLALSQNANLEHLHIYSERLKAIDLSACPNLTYFGYGTRYSSTSAVDWMYKLNQLSSIDFTGCTNLQQLYLEHVHLTSLDLAQFKNLTSLHVENCQDLSISNFNQATSLRTVELPYTTQFADLLTQLPAELVELGLENTNYTLPTTISNAEYIGLPTNAEQIDLNTYPNLNRLGTDGSMLKFSAVANYRRISFDGESTCTLVSPSHPESGLFEMGDTIDLSAEAEFNGVKTVFMWVDAKNNREETSVFVPIEGKPGVFQIGAISEPGNRHYCKIMNAQFGAITGINSRSGWQMRTQEFQVMTYGADAIALAQIVYQSNNTALKTWFANGGWRKSGYTDLGEDFGGVQLQWSEETEKRLTYLSLSFMGDRLTGTIDVSALDRLEYLELPFTDVSGVKLPSNPEKLKWLNLCNTKVTDLDVTACTNLLHLNVQNSALKSCDLSKNTQLERLQLGGTTVALGTNTVYPNMTYFMTADNITSLDLSQMPKLETLNIMNDQLKFSDVTNAHQLNSVSGDSYLTASDVVYQEVSMVAKEAVLDFSPELLVGTTRSTIHGKDSLLMTGISGKYKVDWTKAKLLCIDLTNEMFPGWTLHYPMQLFTEKGDVNYNDTVNVQDVTATVAHIIKNENQIAEYSEYAADVNENNAVDPGDLVGIVNIIMNKPFTKSGELRAAYRPTVDIQMDEKNFLTMENEVPVAALYMEIAGANAETALLADAARLTQASSLKGDTLCIVAYSLDGRTIASGKHIIAQLQPGMHIVKATFSDAQAALLQTTGDLLSTANETIASEVKAKAIYNYPNPTAGQTTFCYALVQPAQSVEIQFFASNGAFVARLQGLPTAAGSQSYATTLPLGAGVYYYRLVIDGKQVTATNTLIIK